MNNTDTASQFVGEEEGKGFIPEKIKDDIARICLTLAVIGWWIYFYRMAFLEEYEIYLSGKFAAMTWGKIILDHLMPQLLFPWFFGMLLGMFAGILVAFAAIAICAVGKAIWLGSRGVINHNVTPAK